MSRMISSNNNEDNEEHKFDYFIYLPNQDNYCFQNKQFSNLLNKRLDHQVENNRNIISVI